MNKAILFSNRYFYFYLLILCWAPLPLGSNRPWAWNLLSALCFVLTATILFKAIRANIDLAGILRRNRVVLGLFLLIPIWVTIQCVPLPANLVGVLSLETYILYSPSQSDWLTISLDPAKTKQMALLSWAYWCFFALTLILVDSPARLRTLLTVIVYCGVFQALYGSFMTLTGAEYGFFIKKEDYLGFATGTFINRNHLAGYLEMCLAVGIGLLVSSLAKHPSQGWTNMARDVLDTILGPKMRLRIYLAIMVIALVLTRSRMGNAAFFASLPLCGILMMILQRKVSRGAIVLFTSLLVIDFFIVGEWFGFEELIERVQNTSAQSEDRDELARNTLVMIRDYPVTGTGSGTFLTTFPRYQSADLATNYSHAHNDYLEFLSTLGIIGFIPMALLVLNSLFNSARVLVARRDGLMKGTAFACGMGITSLLIHSAVDFNLQIPANALLFVLLLALAPIANQLRRESRKGQ